MTINILLTVAAYLLGSIPNAIWIGKSFYGVDVREHGSRNAGATNTLRVLGRRAALPVFILDFLKGTAAVALAWTAGYPNHSNQMDLLEMALTGAAVMGHMFPVFAGFKGGKGVATLAGAVTAMQPLSVGLCFVIFCAVFIITHYVSLSSITAGVCFPFVLIFIVNVHNLPMVLFSTGVAALLLWTHRKNIGRLLKGAETKTHIFKSDKHTPL